MINIFLMHFLCSTTYASNNISKQEIQQDIEQLEQALENRFSYLNTNGFDYKSALKNLKEMNHSGMNRNDLGKKLTRFFANFIDGHASVRGYKSGSKMYLPFLIEPTGQKYVAFLQDRTQFVDTKHPYVHSIDNLPIKTWIQAAKVFHPSGSPQFQQRHALRQLRKIQEIRAELNLPQSDSLLVTLADDNGNQQKKELPLSDVFPSYGGWFKKSSGIIENKIGYLRISRMNDDAVSEIQQWMPQFKHTKGLIIDVRDNGGGTRAALIELFSYLTTADNPPHIANVAKYRLNDAFEDDHLEARFMYRQNKYAPNSREFHTIKQFMKTFKPQWAPPENAFSEWHYLLLSKHKNDKRYHYKKPVIILTNQKGFSATDIFVAALKGWRNVTVIGQPTAGGSARTRSIELKNSGLKIRMASMASFQPSGLLYDGNGIMPDIFIEPLPTDFLKGKTDSVLNFAIRTLNSNR